MTFGEIFGHLEPNSSMFMTGLAQKRTRMSPELLLRKIFEFRC